MNELSTQMERLATDLDGLASRVETDLEAVLGHQCRVSVEEVDPQTGKVSLRADLDLTDLQESLADRGEYDDHLVGVDADSFVFHVAPRGEP